MLLCSDELFVARPTPRATIRTAQHTSKRGSTVNLFAVDFDHRPARIAATIWHSLSPFATRLNAIILGEPTILSLVNWGTGVALLGGTGRSDFMVPSYLRFVFAFPERVARE